MTLERNNFYRIDVLDGLAELADNSVDVIVTSPPYWQARDYDFVSDLGFEKSPRDYVEKFRPIFRGIKRVMKPTGSFWFNIGDCRSQGKRRQRGRRDTLDSNKGPNFGGYADWDGDLAFIDVDVDVPPKSFIGIPEMMMFLAMDEGFIIRDKIIWAKGIQMPDGDSMGGATPSPILDRYMTSWEYLYLMTKDKYGYFNHKEAKIPAKTRSGTKMGANVWFIIPPKGAEPFMKSYGRKNFAVYPVSLTDMVIKAACPRFVCPVCGKPRPMLPHFKSFSHCEHPTPSGHWDFWLNPGLVLDPFMGSGTTAVSAIKYGVDWMGFDASEEQIEYATERIKHYGVQT